MTDKELKLFYATTKLLQKDIDLLIDVLGKSYDILIEIASILEGYRPKKEK